MSTLEQLFQESYRPTDQRKRVSHYAIGSIIGHGRSSHVRCAVDVRDGQKVAIKALARTAGNKGKQRERHFRQEAEVLMRMRHDNIVDLLEVLETARYHYVVMEMVNGCSLRELLQNRCFFTEEKTRSIIAQMTRALQYLHNADVIHRDVKPENVMVVENNGQVKLIDLGLSSVLVEGHSGGQCGSPVYMAPELLRGQQHGPPVDMWSLGVVMHELLTGHVPFRPERSSRNATSNMAAVYSRIIHGACQNVCENVTVCEEGADFLRGLLRLEESARTTSRDALCHSWLTR